MKRLLRLNGVSEEWDPILSPALEALDPSYREWLLAGDGYIPDRDRILAAFSTMQPRSVKYILFGQDPYPRPESAIGYAFIDGRVKEIFSDSGLGREVNRATSLRNFIKMALVADGRLSANDTSQEAISRLRREDLIETMDELRRNFESAGVLLLNTALVFSSRERSRWHIGLWRDFVSVLLSEMASISPSLILFGAHAKEVRKIPYAETFRTVSLEHPYNHTFIQNPIAHDLFGPMELLSKR